MADCSGVEDHILDGTLRLVLIAGLCWWKRVFAEQWPENLDSTLDS
jgi:hypothetical protein